MRSDCLTSIYAQSMMDNDYRRIETLKYSSININQAIEKVSIGGRQTHGYVKSRGIDVASALGAWKHVCWNFGFTLECT